MISQTSSAKIYYELRGAGNGIPLVFLHAFPLNHNMWWRQVRYFEDQYSILVYDLRGFGNSESLFPHYTFEFHADDLINLLDNLLISKVVLCGISMGGYLAFRFAEKAPERIHALIVCDAKTESDSNVTVLKRGAQLRDLCANRTLFTSSFILSVLAKTNLIRGELLREIDDLISQTSTNGLATGLVALATRTDTTAILPNISCPTLLIFGEEDPLFPPTAARELHDRISKSTLRMIPQSGHLPPIENPDAYNQNLNDFLKTLKGL